LELGIVIPWKADAELHLPSNLNASSARPAVHIWKTNEEYLIFQENNVN
jgi:hypothetical protein